MPNKRVLHSALSVCLLAAAMQGHATTQCETWQTQYDALVAQLNADIGCKSGPSNKPLSPMGEGGESPTDPGCSASAQQAERAAWIAKHPEFTKLQNELAQQCRPNPNNVCMSSQIPAIPSGSVDSDGDGISDAEEATLIARFAPYIRFTKGEDRRPINFFNFVKESDLVTPNHWTSGDDHVFIANSFLKNNPLLVESMKGADQGTSLIDSFTFNPTTNRCESVATRFYAIHPYLGDWEGGDPWPSAPAGSPPGMVTLPGMVAHVSPFKPDSLSDLPGEHFIPGTNTPTGDTCARRLDADKCPDKSNRNGPSCAVIPPSKYVSECKHCIKIEYYQFFGLNDDHQAGIANHEGDLSIVTVVFDPDQPGTLPKPGRAAKFGAAIAVSHWIHGLEVRYDLLDPGSHCTVANAERTCLGSNSQHHDVELIGGADFKTVHLNELRNAQNNTVTFHADLTDPNQALPEHPEVFVERGSHEFWPTKEWSVEKAPNHTGDDTAHTYIPQNIPNLGEIEHPNGDLGRLVVNYKGFWGATSTSSLNQSSPGASLHTTWNWFVTAPRAPISCKNAEN